MSRAQRRLVFDPDYGLADRAYDANRFDDAILDKQAIAVIPPMPQRRFPHDWSIDRYRQRKLIERFFNKLKQLHCVARRYDKLLANFLGFVTLAASHSQPR